MWPMTAYRLTPDTLFDCFVSAVRVYEPCSKDENLAQIATLITSSYRTSLANASSKKKVISVVLLSLCFVVLMI